MVTTSKLVVVWLSILSLILIILVTRLSHVSLSTQLPPAPLPDQNPRTVVNSQKATQVPLKDQVQLSIDPTSLDQASNGTLGFEKIFVLNLPSRTDHRDALALAAGFTGLDLEWIDGVQGTTITDNARPFTEGRSHKLSPSELGCWRAHANALEKIVEHNISSALILEGDADWDVRIKEQMGKVGLATRALVQPLISGNGTTHADPTFINASKASNSPSQPLHLDTLPETQAPQLSPYGDDWDVIWLGHCAQRVPALADREDAKQNAEASHLPQGHVIFEDETAPQPQYRHNFNDKDVMPFKQYPGIDKAGTHTRIVHHSMDGMCSSAYAVSQRGARKLLFETGIEAREEPLDFMVQRFCGSDPTGKSRDYENNPAKAEELRKRQRNICLTVQPPLFAQVKMKGGAHRQTDISKGFLGGLFRWGRDLEESKTVNIRQSTRLNLGKLVKGEKDFVDQWPDEDLTAQQ